MMVNQFRIIFRNFIHKPVYSFITFTGFTIGVAASLLIYLWIRNELSYEKFHPDYNRIFRVLTLTREGDEVVKSANCYRPLAKSLKQTYPQIENATYLNYDSEDSPLMKQQGGEKIEARCMSTNDDFFAIFKGFTFLEGTSEKAFSNPSNIVLSETVARKLFGNEPALGKTIISNKYEDLAFTVSGVVRIPAQGHIDFGC
ncbi:MAG: ABC transporter permease, partial [Saccharofermentanaceae bacterium]